MKQLLILLILISQICYGQTCSNDSLFNRFKNDLQFELLRYDNNYIVWNDETRMTYYTFMIKCPIECLAKYVDDSIPSIRAIVFAGLVQKNVDNSLLEEILNKHKNDTAEFLVQSVDVVFTWTVREYMQSFLNIKSLIFKSDTSDYFKFQLENLQNRLRNKMEIKISGEYEGKISKEELLLVDSLKCSSERFRVISFYMKVANKTFVTENIFTQEMKDSIRDMKTGDRLFIDNIMVEVPDRKVRRHVPLILEIR